jgi:hypothetical protein
MPPHHSALRIGRLPVVVRANLQIVSEGVEMKGAMFLLPAAALLVAAATTTGSSTQSELTQLHREIQALQMELCELENATGQRVGRVWVLCVSSRPDEQKPIVQQLRSAREALAKGRCHLSNALRADRIMRLC